MAVATQIIMACPSIHPSIHPIHPIHGTYLITDGQPPRIHFRDTMQRRAHFLFVHDEFDATVVVLQRLGGAPRELVVVGPHKAKAVAEVGELLGR